MRIAILGFACGAAVLQVQAALPSPSTMAALAGVALLLCFLRGATKTAMAGALAGFCWAALLAHLALTPELAKADEGRDITVVGTIDSLPHRFEQGVRFHFRVERVLGDAAVVPPRVSLAWYAGYRDSVRPVADVQPGERWQLVVRLQRPHGNANPHGFDYEAWLLEQGVRATGYVRPEGAANRRMDRFVLGFSNVVEHCRATLRERILRALPDKEYAGVIVALVVGDQRSIGQDDWSVFNRTGVGHLISISGLHITMVAGLFASLASFLWRRSFFTGAQLPLRMPAQKIAALTGTAVALAYVLLAGFGVPAQRTLYMLAVVAAALWFGRLTQVSHVLCMALGLVVLIDPWAIASPGFWLSFGAVAAILYATTGRVAVARPRWSGMLLVGVHTQYVVTLALVPLTMLLFSQVSLVSPLANALAIPLVSFVVTPLALAGSMLPAPVSTLLLNVAHYAVQALAWVLSWCAGSRFAVWSAPTPEPWLFVFAAIGTVWMLAPRGWPHRWTGLAAWLPLLTAQPTHPPPGEVAVTAFDVGQGMALLIETSGHRLLYDTGPAYTPESNGANRVVLPYLKGRGIGYLDGVIVSHSDIDHAGGGRTLLDAIGVGWVASSLWYDHPIVKAAPRHVRCSGGQRWTWDGVRFEMLHPSAASYDDPGLKPNARGCVLRITAGDHAILLAGDIEAAQEAQLVAGSAPLLRAHVLLAPHHGSGTSSTPGFLAAVQPTLVLFQVGYRNRYRHPKSEVVERYERMGIERLRTDESGAVMLDSGTGFRPVEYRRVHARYWHGK
ncbi:DNA internalization-related competence protein ComEC/Rec2 [Massilia atriviolacea]|uniref:DNA internalization-related competence protein ComEC/Rec2 n=1 Tax=Massilia atriviolacea TaxID=2495579 RepID=A0A430HEI7_9BURK|nr:DNA internalization-related competence protein ComEC/Rec2 [Massilia atriviolacea]RSZ55935.1 DNA internalization-related competence protein ComEC/Rec2 [Massilia atriviolacea]